DEAERCSRVGFLNRGKLIATGRPEDLRRQFHGTILEVFASQRFEAKAALTELPHVTEVNLFGEGLHVTVDSSEGASAEADTRRALEAHGIVVTSIRQVEPSIEDVFFQFSNSNGTK